MGPWFFQPAPDEAVDEKKQKNQPLSPRDEADDRLVVSNVRVCVFAMVIDTNGRF